MAREMEQQWQMTSLEQRIERYELADGIANNVDFEM